MRTILRTGLLLSALLAFVLGVKAAEKKKLTCASVEGQYTFVTVWVDGEEEYPIEGEEDIYEITPNAKVELQIEAGAEGKIIDEVKIGASLKATKKEYDAGSGIKIVKWEFKMPNEDAKVTVVLKDDDRTFKLTFNNTAEYTITASTEDGALTSPANVRVGKLVALTITVQASNKKVSNITVGSAGYQSAGKNKWTFSMPAEEVEVKVMLIEKKVKNFTFTNKAGEYTVAATADEAVLSSPAPVEVGATVTVKLTILKANHEVKEIKLKGNTTALKLTTPNTYTFLMPEADVELEVELAPIEPGFVVSWNADEVNEFVAVTVSSEKGELTNGKSKVEAGKMVTIVAPSKPTAVPQKEVSEIKINSTITAQKGTEANTWTFTMPNEAANIVITLKEKKKEKYPLTWDVKDAAVTVKVDGAAIVAGDMVEEGKNLEITVVPNSLKNVVERVKVDIYEAREKDGHYEVFMPNKASVLVVSLKKREANDTKKLTFANIPDQYKVTVKVKDELQTSPASITIGEDVTLTIDVEGAAATAGKVVKEVKVGTAKLERKNFSTWSFEMPAQDATLEVTLEDGQKHKFTFAGVTDQFSVEASTTEGKLTSSPADVKAGEKVTLTLLPVGAAAAAGKVIKSVTVGNEKVTKGAADNTWSFIMPDEDVTLVVTVDFPTSSLTFTDLDGQYSFVVKADNVRLPKSPATIKVGAKVNVKVNVKAAGQIVNEVTLQGSTEKPVKQADETWEFAMPKEDVTLQVSLKPVSGLTLTVNKAEGVEGAVEYTTTPATLVGLEKNATVVFNVTKVPEGKKLVIVAEGDKATVTVDEENAKYTVVLKEEDATVTLKLEDKGTTGTFAITVLAEGADVKIKADGAESDGRNLAEGAKLTFTITPASGRKIESVTFDANVLNPKSANTYEAVMPAHNAKLEVKTALTSAVEDAMFAQVCVTPNPFDNQLRIMSNELRGTYALLNAQGVVVLSGVLMHGEMILNTNELSAGLYLVRIAVASGEAKTYRVIKK